MPCPDCNNDVENAVESALNRVTVKPETQIVIVTCPHCGNHFPVADARGWSPKGRPQLQDEIKTIVSKFSRGGSRVSLGDQKIIQNAVFDFVTKKFRPRRRSGYSIPEDLAKRLETAIREWGDFREPDLLVTDPCMKELCRQLAEWIIANYEEKT